MADEPIKPEHREAAARVWCTPKTSNIVVDTRLAEAFAATLADLEARVRREERERTIEVINRQLLEQDGRQEQGE